MITKNHDSYDYYKLDIIKEQLYYFNYKEPFL
jgi:hypothetical protein